MLHLWFFANIALWSFNVKLLGMKLGFNVFLLLSLGSVWLLKKGGIAKFSVKILFLLLFFMMFSYGVAVAGPCTTKLNKLVFTAPVFLYMILIGLEIGWRATSDDWIKLQKIAPWILLLAFGGFVVEAILPSYFPEQAKYRIFSTYSGIFNEPSHVAFSLFPSLAILFLSERKALRTLGWVSLFLLFIFSRSSTLVAFVMGWFLYQTMLNASVFRVLIVTVALTCLIGLMSVIDYDLLVAPTVERISGILQIAEDDDTLEAGISSLVYLQGWQDAWYNLGRTNGLGLGFNMMGCSPLPDVPTRDIIFGGLGYQLNSDDGSFLFSKIASETGLFGIAFLVVLFAWLIRFQKVFHFPLTHADKQAMKIQSMLIAYFLFATILRGGSYFSPGFMLVIIAISGSVRAFQSVGVKSQKGLV